LQRETSSGYLMEAGRFQGSPQSGGSEQENVRMRSKHSSPSLAEQTKMTGIHVRRSYNECASRPQIAPEFLQLRDRLWKVFNHALNYNQVKAVLGFATFAQIAIHEVNVWIEFLCTSGSTGRRFNSDYIGPAKGTQFRT